MPSTLDSQIQYSSITFIVCPILKGGRGFVKMGGKQNTRGRSFCADIENRPHVFLEYEFDIDAATGAILEFDADLKD